MLVKDRMTQNPVTVSPDTPVSEALNLMRQKKVRRMPVVDRRGHLVGIVAEKDLLYASPSPATSLNVYEIGYLLSKLKVKEIMAKDVVTITEDAPLEEAARIMVDNAVSGLPVVRDKAVVGIITETDIFKILVELLGAREPGLRVTLAVRDAKGTLANITQALAAQGANVISLVAYEGVGEFDSRITIKLGDVDADTVRRVLTDLKLNIVDLRGA